MELPINYYITTYTSFSHHHVSKLLAGTPASYTVDVALSDEYYSKFRVHSERDVFTQIREQAENNNGSAFTIEYGSE